jgi:transcriptional regulator GlxA family with amidase domain
VLLDLMMPEMDGMAVLKAMQADKRLRDIPVIVLTAQHLTGEEMALLNQSVTAVLSKGVFTTQETLAHIEQALARHKRLGTETQRLVRKVMAFIHEYYAQPISRDELARNAGVSERHLNRCFLQETGMAPLTYLTRYRIQQAKALLEKGDLSITEVMGRVGYVESSHFTRVFHREVGVSPSAYKRGERAAGR